MVPYLSKAPKAPTIRTFIAVALPEDLRIRLGAVQTEFGVQNTGLKWVPADLLHITVRFLGPVPETRIEAVFEAARHASADYRAFELHLEGLGAFPNSRRPRVLWAGLRQDDGLTRLNGLFHRLEHELKECCFTPEGRRFSPHITLARIRPDATGQQQEQVATEFASARTRPLVDGTIPVDRLTVMRSDLSPVGPRYTPLFQARLI